MVSKMTTAGKESGRVERESGGRSFGCRIALKGWSVCVSASHDYYGLAQHRSSQVCCSWRDGATVPFVSLMRPEMSLERKRERDDRDKAGAGAREEKSHPAEKNRSSRNTFVFATRRTAKQGDSSACWVVQSVTRAQVDTGSFPAFRRMNEPCLAGCHIKGQVPRMHATTHLSSLSSSFIPHSHSTHSFSLLSLLPLLSLVTSTLRFYFFLFLKLPTPSRPPNHRRTPSNPSS